MVGKIGADRRDRSLFCMARLLVGQIDGEFVPSGDAYRRERARQAQRTDAVRVCEQLLGQEGVELIVVAAAHDAVEPAVERVHPVAVAQPLLQLCRHGNLRSR